MSICSFTRDEILEGLGPALSIYDAARDARPMADHIIALIEVASTRRPAPPVRDLNEEELALLRERIVLAIRTVQNALDILRGKP
jgi:hypothetical protein